MVTGLARSGRKKARPGLVVQRRRIFEAATRVFAHKAADSATVADVVREADISRQTFYRCFSSMDDLTDRLFEHAMLQVVGTVGRLVDTQPVSPTWIRDAIYEVFSLASHMGPLLSLVLKQSQRPGSVWEAQRRVAFEQIVDWISDWAEHAFGATPPRLSLAGALHGIEELLAQFARSGSRVVADRERYSEAAWQVALGTCIAIGIQLEVLRVEPGANAFPGAKALIATLDHVGTSEG